MRIPVGRHPDRSSSLPGDFVGAVYVGDGDDGDDIDGPWRGYCVFCGAVDPDVQPMRGAWVAARRHWDDQHAFRAV
ncbi:hypothetical protein [Kineococcus sp. SYSU DK002]|uniref:hypothetical protein n=1 Tax=Kineococcus sp. SYSU DK002 TaxID=3383123 RepID=UPI003D7E0007